MKNSLIGFVLVPTITMVWSCDKNLETEETDSNSILPKQIVVTELDSPIVVTSVEYYGAIYPVNYSRPYPLDSTSFREIDINSDSINDIRITMGHEYDWQTNSGPQSANYTNWKLVSGINETEIPCCSGSFHSYTLNRGFGSLTKLAHLESDDDYSSISGGAIYYGIFASPEVDEFYICFRKMINGRLHYGWLEIHEGISKFSLVRYGYNLTPNQSIRAGEE